MSRDLFRPVRREKMLVLLLVVAFTFPRCGAGESNLLWFIGPSSALSGDNSTSPCGETVDNPCRRLDDILIPVEAGECVLPSPATAGTNSTTFVLLQGVHKVRRLCFRQWSHLSIVGLADTVVTVQGESAPSGDIRGVLAFDNCSNVIIANLGFSSMPPGYAGIHFKSSSVVAVEGSQFMPSSVASIGIFVDNPQGLTIVSSCIFMGTGAQVQGLTGIDVAHGAFQKSTVDPALCTASRNTSATTYIRNSQFSNFYSTSSGSASNAGLFSYNHAKTAAAAVRVVYRANVCRQTVTLFNNSFSSNVMVDGSTVVFLFEASAKGNQAIISGNTFFENIAAYGAGLSFYFWTNSAENLGRIISSVFELNYAQVEGGGVFAGFFSTDTSNKLIVEACSFKQNFAPYGSALYITNSPHSRDPPEDIRDSAQPPLVEVVFNGNNFNGNAAFGSGSVGVVTLVRIDATFSGSSNFRGNNASGVAAAASLLRMSGMLLFEGNSARAGACLYAVQGTRIDFRDVDSAQFINNNADSGGVISADAQTSAQLINDYIHEKADGLIPNRMSCFIRFRDITTTVRTRFLFENNSAVLYGSSYFLPNLRACDLSYFVPANVALLVSRFESNEEVEYLNTPLQSGVSTGPSFLLFYGASTRCFKTVANISYLLPNCSNNLTTSIFLEHPDLKCGLQRLTAAFPRGFGLFPTMDQLLRPWAGVNSAWDHKSSQLLEMCPEPTVSQILLSPASGEQFDITIQLLDQLLNLATASVTLQVRTETPGPNVLLQANGLQYGTSDNINFHPNRALTGLAMVGLPKTRGHLIVSVDSQVSFQTLVLTIPFELAHCPLGLLPPAILDAAQVQDLIVKQYTVTQRIPDNDLLACRCISNFYNGFGSPTVSCIRGYTAVLSNLLWMGPIPGTGGDADEVGLEVPCTTERVNPIPEISLTNWVQWNARLRHQRIREGFPYPLTAHDVALFPVDVAKYEGDIVPGGGAPVRCYATTNISSIIGKEPERTLIFPCPTGYCKMTDTSTWAASDSNGPCITYREGFLCGQCMEGYAVTSLSNTCINCQGSNPALVIFLHILFGLVLVAVAVGLNIAAIPAVDTLLFLCQSAVVLFNNRPGFGSFSHLGVLGDLDFSFGQCFTPDFTALERLAWQFFSPAFILFLLVILIILSKTKCFSKLSGKHSFLKALWFLILLSYSNLLVTSYSIVHCTPIAGVSYSVLLADASVRCFTGVHLILAILAIILLSFVILPFPLYLTVLLCFPRWKPFVDVYAGVYKDKLRWWVLCDLGRRIVIVSFGVFVQNFYLRQFAFLVLFVHIALLYGWFRPYNNEVDNAIELLAVKYLVIVSALSIVSLDQSGVVADIAVAVSWLLILSVLTVCLVRIARYVWKQIRSYYEKKTGREVPRAGKVIAQNVHSLFTQVRRIGKSNSMEMEETGVFGAEERASAIPDFTQYREPLLNDEDLNTHAAGRKGRRYKGSGSSSTMLNGSSGASQDEALSETVWNAEEDA